MFVMCVQLPRTLSLTTRKLGERAATASTVLVMCFTVLQTSRLIGIIDKVYLFANVFG